MPFSPMPPWDSPDERWKRPVLPMPLWAPPSDYIRDIDPHLNRGLMDMYADVMGIGDPRKERYLSETQGGYPYRDREIMPYRNIEVEFGPLRSGIGSLGDQAAVDPSDWRVLQQILSAGGNPDDYLETAMGPDEGIMGLV